MKALLDPKNDYVFKRLFADNSSLLVALINAIRPHAPPITQIEVKNPAIDADDLQGKYIILDLLAVDADGRQFNIEMQVRRYRAWSARSSYYLAKLISGQLLLGDDDTQLKPVIGIHLLDFDLFEAPEHQNQALWCFEMRDADTPAVTLGEELQLNLLELRKADRLKQVSGALADWILLFRHWQEEDIMAHIANEPVRTAFEKLKTLSDDDEARRRAFVRERALLDERSLLKDAHDQGWEQGIEQGKQQGAIAALRQTATNLMQATTLDDAAIADINGLGADDIAALRNKS